MSVTIHYNGKINRAHLADLLDAARLFCAEQRWAARDIDDPIIGYVERDSTAPTSTKVKQKPTKRAPQARQTRAPESTLERVPIDDTLTGLTIIPGKSDPFNLTFNHAGVLISYLLLSDGEYWERKSLFVQSPTLDKHLIVCEFFHLLQDNYMPDLHVYDEGGYYDSGNTRQLGDAFAASATQLDTDELAESEEPTADPDPASEMLS